MGAKRKAIAALSFVLLSASAVQASAEAQPAAMARAGGVELHFAPTENLEAVDLGLLGTAQKSVDLAAYHTFPTTRFFRRSAGCRSPGSASGCISKGNIW